ncbi:hypothetical protein LXL04_034986 [Taraxacum kok-saghyz]
MRLKIQKTDSSSFKQFQFQFQKSGNWCRQLQFQKSGNRQFQFLKKEANTCLCSHYSLLEQKSRKLQAMKHGWELKLVLTIDERTEIDSVKSGFIKWRHPWDPDQMVSKTSNVDQNPFTTMPVFDDGPNTPGIQAAGAGPSVPPAM